MSKKKNEETALAVIEPYAIMSLDPSELKATISENLGQDRLDVSDLDLVKMPSGGAIAWTLPGIDRKRSVETFSGIIIHVLTQRVYWQKAFTGEQNPPDCFSSDGMIGTGTPGGACDTCPLSQWGSAEKGNGQACRQNRLLFILTEDSILPLVLRLSPTSLGPAKKYFVRLAGKTTPYSAVVTRFGLKEEKSGGGIAYSSATFEVERILEPDEIAKIRQYQQGIRPILEKTRIPQTPHED